MLEYEARKRSVEAGPAATTRLRLEQEAAKPEAEYSATLLEYEAAKRAAAASSWIPPGSEGDPRLYVAGKTLTRPKSGPGKARRHAFAEFVAEKSNGQETVSGWERDLGKWVARNQTISPNKLRRLCELVDGSWIRAFHNAGYILHLVVMMNRLFAANRKEHAAFLAAYVFRTWTADDLITLDFVEPGGIFDRLLPKIEAFANEVWEAIPARVSFDDLKGDRWTLDIFRCVLRLCDPNDYLNLGRDAFRYPSLATQEASAYLLRRLLGEAFDPFDRNALHQAAVKAGIASAYWKSGA